MLVTRASSPALRAKRKHDCLEVIQLSKKLSVLRTLCGRGRPRSQQDLALYTSNDRNTQMHYRFNVMRLWEHIKCGDRVKRVSPCKEFF